MRVVHGIIKNDIVPIGGNFVAVVLNSIVLCLKIKYSRSPLN
jgi:hypothetical protein